MTGIQQISNTSLNSGWATTTVCGLSVGFEDTNSIYFQSKLESDMIINKKDLRLYRIVSFTICIIAIVLIFTISKTIGYILLALGLYFLFAPHKEGDSLPNHPFSEKESRTDIGNKTEAIWGLLNILYSSSSETTIDLDLPIKIRHIEHISVTDD